MTIEPSVETRVIAAIGGHFNRAVTLETNLEEDLGADSLDFLEVNMALEEEFDIYIPDDIERFTSVGDAIHYVKQRIGEHSGKTENQEKASG